MITPTVRIEDRGKADWDRWVERFKKINDAYVTIGVHEDAGNYSGPHAPSVVEVALWNEFGTEHIPSRPFLAMAIDEKINQINNWREEAIDKILNEGWSVEKGLDMLGLKVQVLVQNKIKSNVPPPNAPSTVKEKQRSGVLPKHFKAGANSKGQLYSDRTKTLIDTGLLLRSITYRVFVK